MATGTAFHARTASLCRSHDWRQWSGYLAAGSYDEYVQPEYAAIRHAAALIDISPLYKYVVEGPDAPAVMNYVCTQDVAALEVGRVSYTPWCDSAGKVRQDGTVFRLADDRFQLNAAEPALGWLTRNAAGRRVTLTDQSTAVAALSLQGPRSRDVLVDLAGPGIGDLGFFKLTRVSIGGVPVTVSRTGYTGDLGYELWMPSEDAVRVWDTLMSEKARHPVTPCGLKAMDIARVEAGFVLINVDYVSAETALVDDDRMSPYELGLGWTVKLQKPSFVGRSALLAERTNGSARQVVGLVIDWEPLERAYLDRGVMPDLPQLPVREPVPVYTADGGRQVGRATTRVWSTLLKKYLALVTVERRFAEPDTRLELEVTVRYERHRVPGRVTAPAFYRPARMRA